VAPIGTGAPRTSCYSGSVAVGPERVNSGRVLAVLGRPASGPPNDRREVHTMRGVMIVFLIFGALPLVAYPAAVIASVMGLAGHKTGDEPRTRSCP
jgi:hypothetical protein